MPDTASSYTPSPIDTEGVTVPDSLVGLTEHLAAHIHDVWAEGRLAEG